MSREWSNVTRSGKLHFSQDQFEIAKKASAMEYALKQGYVLVGEGYRRTMIDHDSMIFLGDGRWYWNSQGRSGRAIEFIMYYENHSLPEAVLILNGVDINAPTKSYDAVEYRPSPQNQATKKPDFVLPERASDMRRSFGYLSKTRGIDYGILRTMVEQGRIYETITTKGNMAYHNVAFAGLNDDGVIKALSLRGCTEGSHFKAEVPGSDKRFPFVMPGQNGSSSLCVFESAIDAMSHATIEKLTGLDWSKKHRVAMSGNNTIAPIMSQLIKIPEIRKIVFCLDNDKAGHDQFESYRTALIAEGFPAEDIRFHPAPFGKDWNEYLVKWRSVIQQHKQIQTTDADADLTHPVVGRIHFLDENGQISATSAVNDPERFHQLLNRFSDLGIPMVVETKAQLEELHRQTLRRQAAKETR